MKHLFPLIAIMCIPLESISRQKDASEIFGESMEQLSDIEKWKLMAPNFHIDDTDFQNTLSSSWLDDIDLATQMKAKDRMIIEGYFQLPPQQLNLQLDDMTDLMDDLSNMGLPVVFCMLFDEFWLPFLKLDSVLESILGMGYLKLPDFWAWKINHKKEEAGWSPHVDKSRGSIFPNGLPKTISLWIPLSDATLDNGCMYVLPADRDPTYGIPDEDLSNVHWAEFISGLRALPAKAGSVLAWNSQVWHYGSQSNERAQHDRYSISFEFQTGNIPPIKPGVMEPSFFPSFEERLALILKQIVKYRHMYPMREDLITLATKASSISDCVM